jgi:hypothetical protein
VCQTATTDTRRAMLHSFTKRSEQDCNTNVTHPALDSPRSHRGFANYGTSSNSGQGDGKFAALESGPHAR